MARRKQQSGAELVVYVVVMAIAYAMAYLVPLALLGWWVFIQRRSRETDVRLAAANLGMTAVETKTLNDVSNFVELGRIKLDNAWEDGKRSHLAMRSDGMFDERSSRGRELNATIRETSDYIQKAQQKEADVLSDVESRRQMWLSFEAQRRAFRPSVYAWLGSIVIFTFVKPHWTWFGVFAVSGLICTIVAVGVTLLTQSQLHEEIISNEQSLSQTQETEEASKTQQSKLLLE